MQGHGLRITRENTHLIREAGFVCGPGRRQRDCAEKLKTRGTAGWDRVADGPSAVKFKPTDFRGLADFQDPKIIGH